MGTILNMQLKGTSAPPPATRSEHAATVELRRRARRAIRLLERGLLVTDEIGYTSRNTAKATARRLVENLERFEGVERPTVATITRLRADGWHWWVGWKRPPGQPGQQPAQAQAAA